MALRGAYEPVCTQEAMRAFLTAGKLRWAGLIARMAKAFKLARGLLQAQLMHEHGHKSSPIDLYGIMSRGLCVFGAFFEIL
jgi:hypothetical protein